MKSRFAIKKIFLLLLMMFIGWMGYAQQDPQYSQYMFNTLAINPGYAGSLENTLSATALFRWQWVGIEGAPVTQSFSAHAPLRNNTIGLGGIIVNDNIGVTNALTINGTAAYRLRFKKINLALGMHGGVRQYRANYALVNASLANGFDPAFAENISRSMPVLGVGLFLHSSRFYVGISTPQMLNTRQRVEGIMVKHFSHFFLTSGYVFDLGSRLSLKPSVMLKYVNGSDLSADFNANLWFREMFAVGLSYRMHDALYVLVEIRLPKNIGLGYAYDYTLTRLRVANSGSHELMLRYQMRSNRDKIITPRIF